MGYSCSSPLQCEQQQPQGHLRSPPAVPQASAAMESNQRALLKQAAKVPKLEAEIALLKAQLTARDPAREQGSARTAPGFDAPRAQSLPPTPYTPVTDVSTPVAGIITRRAEDGVHFLVTEAHEYDLQ